MGLWLTGVVRLCFWPGGAVFALDCEGCSNKRFASCLLFAYNGLRMKYFFAFALLLCACEPVRTVYDEHGVEVKEREPGKETDLMSRYEERIDASFQRKKNADGVPQAVSSRVSSFQKDLDAARGTDERFSTRAFSDVRENDALSTRFKGAKEFSGSKSYAGVRESSYDVTRQPDFLNEHRGLAHESYREDQSTRSPAEGSVLRGRDDVFETNASDYNRDMQSGYFESRRQKTSQPVIRDYKDFYNKEVYSTRSILGRDQSDTQK